MFFKREEGPEERLERVVRAAHRPKEWRQDHERRELYGHLLFDTFIARVGRSTLRVAAARKSGDYLPGISRIAAYVAVLEERRGSGVVALEAPGGGIESLYHRAAERASPGTDYN